MKRGIKRTAAGAAPRESHPSGGLPEPYSLPVTPRRLKTAARSDYDDKGVPLCPLRVVARKLPHLLHGESVCRSLITGVPTFGREIRSWRTLRPARRRRDVSVCLMLRRNYPPGFLCQAAWLPDGKGNIRRRPGLVQVKTQDRDN